jgi:integrase
MGFHMSSKQAAIPAYRRHKPSGQAVVTLNGRDCYLGRFGSPESKLEYDRVTSEWLARGRRLAVSASELLIKEVIAGYYGHAFSTMRDPEVEKVKAALRPVRELYGETKASEFGPIAYRVLRQKLIDYVSPRGKRLCISTIRDRMGIIRRMIAWGVEYGMMPADTLQRILAIPPLRARRDGVKPARKVRPAPEADIQAILPHLNATVRAMVELQALTGMRPGEVWSITTGQIERAGEVWIYRPCLHKNVDRGQDRAIPLGPRAQEVVKPWLRADPDAPLFSAREAAERHYEATRKRPKAQAARRQAKRRKTPRGRNELYNKNSYSQAIARACQRAGVPVFRPNQIRHTVGTKVRGLFGLEHAQVLLGHAKADVTQRYAERDLALARDVAAKIG